MRDDVPSPKMPIPGAAGAAITAALAALAVHAGEAELTIKKVRVPRGGYSYVISKNPHTAVDPR
jgi:hypothetical protein